MKAVGLAGIDINSRWRLLLVFIQPPVRRLHINGSGEVPIEAVVLVLHHNVPIGQGRDVLQVAPLLPWHGLPHYLDVVEARLHGERRRHRDVHNAGHATKRQVAIGWHQEVVAQVVMCLLDCH